MCSFLQIKIYRNKFIAYMIFVILLGATLGAVAFIMLLNQWVDNVRNEAANVFSRVETKLLYDADRIEAYMQRIYSNHGLMTDVRYFLGNSAEGYLSNRLMNSNYNQPLVSFPSDMKSFLYSWAQGDITQVSLHTEQQGNVITFDKHGNVSFLFQVPNSDETFRETIDKGFVIRKKLSDPNQITREIGEFRFLLSSEQIFNDVRNYNFELAGAVSKSGDVHLITSGDQETEELLRLTAAEDHHNGYLSTDGLGRVFYMTYTSSHSNYQLVAMVDLSRLVKDNATVIAAVFLLIVATMVSVLLLIVYNLRDDAKFLARIINSIKRVKTANFTPNTPARYRKNEYGMIAEELDDMVKQLGKHIRTEYLLKLKQQETEMKALQHQINPHFLYNTLEAIRSTALVNKDTDTADAIATLGGLYRDILKTENIITIGKELELLKKYLMIMEFKYPDRFYYQYNVDESLQSLTTVKFWMQPLAENFFVHGFNSKNEYNLLMVNGWENEDNYVIQFMDNGTFISEQRLEEIRSMLIQGEDHSNPNGHSIGLRNVYTRLHFFYGDAFSMSIHNNEEAGVKITVMISKE